MGWVVLEAASIRPAGLGLLLEFWAVRVGWQLVGSGAVLVHAGKPGWVCFPELCF